MVELIEPEKDSFHSSGKAGSGQKVVVGWRPSVTEGWLHQALKVLSNPENTRIRDAGLS